MATTPKNVNLTADTVKILNGIRNQASAYYKDYVPAIKDASQVKEIGSIIMNYDALQNEFLSALINRIGLVIVTSKSYQNPISMFKKGMLEFGESIEEIFVNISRGYDYDPADASETLFKRYIPDVRASFHVLNFQKFYPTTVSQQQLAQAFLSAEGVFDLVSKITETLYTEMNYDEFLVMKYTLAKRILNGQTYPVTVDTTDAKAQLKAIRKVSNDVTFLSNKYNPTAVYNHTPKENQYIIINSKYDAEFDVDALAYAFNMAKVDIDAHKVLIDGFGQLDIERLNQLLGSNKDYKPLTDAELKALDEIPCVLVDDKFFMVYDNLLQFKEVENGKGLYWNYFLHAWKTFSTSPFSNAITFVPDTPAVTSVKVSPTSLSLTAGAIGELNVVVTTEGMAPKSVTYTSDNTAVATVDIYGNVTAIASGSANITVTSTYDTTKSATVKITVA